MTAPKKLQYRIVDVLFFKSDTFSKYYCFEQLYARKDGRGGSNTGRNLPRVRNDCTYNTYLNTRAESNPYFANISVLNVSMR